MAQIDTSKTVLIQEIIVQGNAKDKMTKASTDIPDLQTNTDKLLENTAGVTLIKRGNFAQEPTIRGLNAGQINTTIDGMQMFGACTDRMDPISSYIEPNNLSSISLNLGPNDQQFGSNIGGGFDFNLKKATLGDSNRFSGLAGIGYETNANAYQALGALQFSQNKWAVRTNYIFRKADNYLASNREEILFSQYEKWNLGVNTMFQPFSHHTFALDYIQDEGSNIGYPALTMDVAFAKAKIGAVTHTYKCGHRKLYQWETKLYANYVDHAMDDTKRPAELVPMHMDMPGNSFTAGFYSNASWRLGERNYLSVKLNGYQNDLHAEMTMYPDNGAEMFMLTIPDARRDLVGLDISDKFYVNKKLKLTYGGRLEGVKSSIITNMGRKTLTSLYPGETTKHQLIYSGFVQGDYAFNKKWFATAGVSKAMRSATLQELYGFYLFNRMDGHDYLGNPDIKPEESWNLNGSVKYNTSKVLLSANVFGYFFTNYIAGLKLNDYSVMTIGGLGVKQYNNLPSAKLLGFEFVGKYKISNHLIFNSTNSFSYGVDNRNEALPFIPPFKTINSLRYDLKGYNFSVESKGATDQRHTSIGLYGEKPSTSFHVMNIRAGKSFKIQHYVFELKMSLENIFDTQYYEHLDIMKINRQGRNLILHATVQF
jgi:iron complex outermembrane receptor protein